MVGVTDMYYSFLEYLEEQKEKISVLQLSGRIEGFLVKEFVYHVYKKTKGKNFVLTNYGCGEDKQYIDICLIREKSNFKPEKNDKIEAKYEIYGMIEAKYIRNRQRFFDYDAKDEITGSLTTSKTSLKRQLRAFEESHQGKCDVNLLSKTNNIYGLVFASYVSEEKDEKEKKGFYQRVLKEASDSFRYHDLTKPYFNAIFDDAEVKVLESTYYITLRAGLWVNAQNASSFG